jgi:hypothetical protein
MNAAALHLRALVEVARIYRLHPRRHRGGWRANCPACGVRELAIFAASETRAGGWACGECRTHGRSLNGLQRLSATLRCRPAPEFSAAVDGVRP